MTDIKLTLGDNTYLINPSLTLGEYMTLSQNKDDVKDPLKLMGMLTGIPIKELKKIDQERANYITSTILQKKLDRGDKSVKATFEFKGVLYGLETDLTKINFGGWVDLETFIALGQKDHLNKITAIYYRPIVAQLGKTYVLEEYDSDKMMERAELFKELPFDYVIGAQRFFLEFTNQYIKSITRSLKLKTKKNLRRKKAQSIMKRILPKYLNGKFVRAFTTIN